MLSPPLDQDDLEEFVDLVGEAHGGIEECDALVAQSLIFHALDYARELGFAPSADFHEALVVPGLEDGSDCRDRCHLAGCPVVERSNATARAIAVNCTINRARSATRNSCSKSG